MCDYMPKAEKGDIFMKNYLISIMVFFFVFLNFNVLLAAQKANFGGAGRYGAAGFAIGNKGYIGTGYDDSKFYKDFWEYNSTANVWTQKAEFGGGGRYGAVAFAIGDKGYIGTGVNSVNAFKDFWEYDPVDNSWTQKADFGGTERYGAVSFVIGSNGYVALGSDNLQFYKECWMYDPVTDVWTQKADFGGAERYAAVGFVIGNKGYIGTGVNGLSAFKDFWEYDPDADTWAQKADFGGKERYGAVGFAIGNKGYIGTGNYGETTYNDFGEYDSVTNVWTQKSDFEGPQRAGAVSVTINNVYIGMGKDDKTTYNDFWEYEPNRDAMPNKFTFTDQINVAWSKDITSNTITVSGINVPVVISVTGGTYSINGSSYTDENGTVNNGDSVSVKQTSASSSNTKTDVTLTIGNVSDVFSVTTKHMIDVGDSDPFCFIATAAFGSPLAKQVEILRKFRDQYLLTNHYGRKFVSWYYRHGPSAAKFIQNKPLVKATVRAALYPLIGFSLLLISGYLPLVIVSLLFFALLLLRYKPRISGAT